MFVGTKLTELRKSKGLSQEDLATDLDISQSSISNYELGVSKPDVSTLEKYTQYFQVPLNSFFTDDNYTFYNSKNKGNTNNLVINDLSEKLIESMEKRLNNCESIISTQKETINTLNITIIQLQKIITSLKI